MPEPRIYSLANQIVSKCNELVVTIRENHSYGFGAETNQDALEELQSDLSEAIDDLQNILISIEDDIKEIEEEDSDFERTEEADGDIVEEDDRSTYQESDLEGRELEEEEKTDIDSLVNSEPDEDSIFNQHYGNETLPEGEENDRKFEVE